MVQLNGRQWGLVAVVAGSPFFLAFLLAASSPGLVQPVLGTALGAASWVLAALLGLLGGALFASGLGQLRRSDGFSGSALRRSLGLGLAAVVPVALCIVPAVGLLIAGPVVAVRVQQGEVSRQERPLFGPQELAERLLQRLPRRVVPSLPRL